MVQVPTMHKVLGPKVFVHFKASRWQLDVAQPKFAANLQPQHSLTFA